MDLEFKTFKLRRDPACPVCGDHPTITEPIDYEQFCGVPILDPKSLEETEAEVKDAKAAEAPGSPVRRSPTRRSTRRACRRATRSSRTGKSRRAR